MRLITESQDRDLWLIGHANNFRSFFKSTFDLEVDFDYAETHSVFKMCGQNTPEFFVPPYSFYINQSTGKIEGKFSGELRFVHAQDLSPMPSNVHVHPSELDKRSTSSQSYRVMHHHGLHKDPKHTHQHREDRDAQATTRRAVGREPSFREERVYGLGIDFGHVDTARESKWAYPYWW